METKINHQNNKRDKKCRSYNTEPKTENIFSVETFEELNWMLKPFLVVFLSDVLLKGKYEQSCRL